MSDIDIRLPGAERQRFPGTEFICALFKMSPAQRLNASAERAAQRYGLSLEECEWWINHARHVDEQWPMRR